MKELALLRRALRLSFVLPAAVLAIACGGGSGASPSESPGATQYPLIVAVAGNGAVVSQPSAIQCTTGSGSCSATFDAAAVVTLSAIPGTDSTFVGWGSDGASCGMSASCTLAMNQARQMSATFAVNASNSYTLSVTKAGTGSGTVSSSVGGVNCGSSCGASIAAGTAVTLTATAANGSTFTGWSGACSGTGSCSITMNGNVGVTATFAGPANYTLSVNKIGAGAGTVTPSTGGVNCGSDSSEVHAAGAAVTLSANAAKGSTF